VAAWADQSGNGNHFTQVTVSGRPTFQPVSLNGKPGLHFDGNDLLRGLGWEVQLIRPEAYTAFFVFSVDTFTTNSTTTTNNAALFANLASSWGPYFRSSGPTVLAYHNDGAPRSANNTLAASMPYVLMHRYDGTNITNRLGLGTRVNAAAGNVVTPTSHPVIGRNASSLHFNGRIHEIAIYDDAKSTSDQDAIATYLKDFWGI
jgi:hypothetical protein